MCEDDKWDEEKKNIQMLHSCFAFPGYPLGSAFSLSFHFFPSSFFFLLIVVSFLPAIKLCGVLFLLVSCVPPSLLVFVAFGMAWPIILTYLRCVCLSYGFMATELVSLMSL